MPRVTIGRVYAIAHWNGRRRGRSRIGGFAPKNQDKYEWLHSFNMPTFDLVARSLVNRNGTDGYALAGQFWALVSIAANRPIRGVLAVERHNGSLSAQTDSELAAELGLTEMQWAKSARELLACGLLTCSEMQIDVEDDQVLRSPTDRQGELFVARESESRTSTFPGGAKSNRTESTMSEVTEPNRGRNEPGSRPADAPNDRNGSEIQALRQDGTDNGASLDVRRRRLVAACELAGDVKLAERIWLELLADLLGPGDNATILQRMHIFTQCWTRTGGGGFPPNGSLRAQRLNEAVEKAVGIHNDRAHGGVSNPVAVFNAWAQNRGWLRKREREREKVQA